MVPSKELSSEALTALYGERWREVRHLDDLDRREIILVVTALTGAIVSQQSSVGLGSDLRALLAVLAAFVCTGGIYSTIRNRISMLMAISTIDAIEALLEERQVGLFPDSGSFRGPQTIFQFGLGLLRSIRGPIVGFFSAPLAFLFWRWLRV